MIKKVINITEEALTDMEKIYNYIAYELLAPENAVGQYNRIADAILKLDFFSERFAVFESEPEHPWGMRRMIADNFLVCYISDDHAVTVTDVIYGASNVHYKLGERHNF